MKKHNVRAASLLLACLIALLMPAQAWAAAQNDEKEMGGGLEAEGPGSPEEDAKEDGGHVPAEEEEKEVSDALNQPGEVTEPITKEDKPYLALGANLTPEQQALVLGFLGVDPAELSD